MLWYLGLGAVWAIWTICLFTILLSGRWLATWMFLNSLQLVAHLVLFKSQMPSSAAYFIGQLLFVARWNPFPLWNGMNDQFGYVHEGGHDVRFVGYGYESIYLLANLSFIVLVGAFVLFVWLLLWAKDAFAARFGRSLNLKERIWFDPLEPRWHNLAQRFAYEVFLELIICTMISLAARRTYTRDNFSTEEEIVARFEEGVGGEYEILDKILAGIVLFLATCFFIWAASFAWR